MRFPITAISLMTSGFILGWYIRGWYLPSAPDLPLGEAAGSLVGVSANSADSPRAPNYERTVKPASNSNATSNIHGRQAAAPVADQAVGDKLDIIENIVDEFKRLLDSEQYEQAVIHYGKYAVDRANSQPLMRSILRNTLNTYRLNQDEGRFFVLSDAWLTAYYSDTDILIIVIKYHRDQGHLDEALNQLQVAKTYAHGDASQVGIRNAQMEFVAETDRELARSEDWRRLQSFYEGLRSRDLAQPEDLLRLAELYLAGSRESEGKEMLQELAGNSRTQAKAEALLDLFAKSDRFQPQQNRAEDFATTISMQKFGRHYLLPLSSGRSNDVSLILDTGASITLMSESGFQRFTESSRTTYLGSQLFNTANGVARGHSYRVYKVKFGPFEFKSLDVSVADNDFGSKVDGLLGMNVLQQFVFQIDQDKSELKLTRRSTR